MKKEFKTKIELLNDTIAYYWGRPDRQNSSPDGNCMYVSVTPGSEGCAIGRLISDDTCKLLEPNGISKSLDEDLFQLLPEWLQAFGLEFLQGLQQCHDGGIFKTRQRRVVLDTFTYDVPTSKITFPD